MLKSGILTPASLVTQFGTTDGSLPSLGLLQQNGLDDHPAAYVAFQTNGTSSHYAYKSYYLPADTRANLISTMLLQVNFKGPASATQVWTWSMYDWNTNLWIKMGDSIGTSPDQWNTLVFRVRNVQRYVSPGGEMRIQLRSSNANGVAKVDYEALHITYLSLPATPTPYAPPVAPPRPGVFSVP